MKREAIVTAIAATLTGVDGIEDTSVFRSATEPFVRNILPAVSVEPLSDVCDVNVIGYLDWKLSVRITVFVMAKVPDQIAAPSLVSIHSKVMSDVTLGGLAMDLVPTAVKYDFIDGDQPVATIAMDYSVDYRTLVGDLSA